MPPVLEALDYRKQLPIVGFILPFRRYHLSQEIGHNSPPIGVFLRENARDGVPGRISFELYR